MMHNKLRIPLIAALCFCALLILGGTAPSAFATTSKSSSTLGVAKPNNRFKDGYNAGYSQAVKDCKVASFAGTSLPSPVTDFDRGFVQGYNFARANDVACKKGTTTTTTKKTFTDGYSAGYSQAVKDCKVASFAGPSLPSPVTDFDKGFVNGYNFARANDAACKKS